MNRHQIVEAFRHHPPSAESTELQERASSTLTTAVAEIAGDLPECSERSAFIDLCRRALAMANAAALRREGERPIELAGARDALPVDLPVSPQAGISESGVVHLSLNGEFHRATMNRPSFEGRLDTPEGTYARAIFRFRLHHGGWNNTPSRNQNLFWFARDRHVDLFGFGVARGPGGPPQIFYRTDWGIQHTSKQRVTKRFLMEAGETYDVRFDFDAGGGQILLTLADSSGTEVMRSVGVPNIAEIQFASGQKIAVGFGFRGEHDTEPAQPGCVWSDLRIELEPATK